MYSVQHLKNVYGNKVKMKTTQTQYVTINI